jgi:S-formylglutathione hydrolase FrmB
VLYTPARALDDHTAWLRNTSVERYAAAAGVAVRDAAGSTAAFYANEVNGTVASWDYVADELPGIVVATSSGPISQDPGPDVRAGLALWAGTAR